MKKTRYSEDTFLKEYNDLKNNNITNFLTIATPFKKYLISNLKIITNHKYNKYKNTKDYFDYIAEVITKIAFRIGFKEKFSINLSLFGDCSFSISLEQNSNITTIDSRELYNYQRIKLPFSYYGELKLNNHQKYYEKCTRDGKPHNILRSVPGYYDQRQSGYYCSYDYSLKNNGKTIQCLELRFDNEATHTSSIDLEDSIFY